MNLQNEMHKYLKKQPLARERRFKDRACVNLLLEMYPAIREIPKETLIAIVQDYNSLDRYWRLLTAEYPELRGKDYDTKVKVVQRKQKELGYESGYFENVKKLKTLV